MQNKKEKRLSELKYIIEDKVRECIHRYFNHSTLLNTDPLIEMSKLNGNDIGNVPFPCNKFDIRIWSNDHNPPHFHIKYDGWDISFLIENGEEYRVNKYGNSSVSYSYINENVLKWLNGQSNLMKRYNNQDTCKIIWNSYHKDTFAVE